MTPELAARLRVLIDNDVRARGDRWPRARVWSVHATEALFEYFLGEGGEVYEFDLDKVSSGIDFVDDEELVRATYQAAVNRHPELAELLDLPMPARREAPYLPKRSG